ncbi:MAG: YibE/F family protein [Peptoniphilaceae bacterium]
MNFKKIIIFLALTLSIFINTNVTYANKAIEDLDYGEVSNVKYEKALVKKVLPFSKEDEYGNKTQNIEVEFLSGPNKGKSKIVTNSSSKFLNTNLEIKKNQKILVMESTDYLGGINYSVADHLRTDSIYILIGVFALLLLIIGRKKGLFAIISLSLTFGIIIFAAIPLIIKGYSPSLVAIISSIIIANLTIFIVSGFNKKSLSAILGTCFGTIIAGLISYFVGNHINLTGLSLDEMQVLMALPNGLKINPRELLFAGIIWGSLGAVMDVGMSIASSIFEISSANENLTFKELLKSGMNVGRDIMSTMSNTLILAYIGSALPLILIMILFNDSNYKILNLDVIATEIVRSISGSIGLILAIPLTAIIAGIFIKKTK